MGGFGSGRRSDTGRSTVETCRNIDIHELRRTGYLEPGQLRSMRWRRGDRELGSIAIRAEHDSVVLIYRCRVGTADWQDIQETVTITRVPCNLGGSRPYFLCPGVVNGVGCGRRVAKLYAGDRYFLCRHCYRLAYTSQREDEWGRALRRADKSRQRLGADRRDQLGACTRPPGMWHRTYARLLDEATAAQATADELFVQRVSRLLGPERPRGRRRDFWR